MESILPFSEVKSHLSEIADRVEQQRDRIMVTRNGRPSFMLVNCDYFESMEETLEIMSDPELADLAPQITGPSRRGPADAATRPTSGTTVY